MVSIITEFWGDFDADDDSTSSSEMDGEDLAMVQVKYLEARGILDHHAHHCLMGI